MDSNLVGPCFLTRPFTSRPGVGVGSAVFLPSGARVCTQCGGAFGCLGRLLRQPEAWGIPYPGASFLLVLCVGSRHWAHLLLPVHPPAGRLGLVSPGELQEAGVKGLSSPLPWDLTTPAHPDRVCYIPGRPPWILSFSYSDLFCNRDLLVSPLAYPGTTYFSL